MMKLELNIQLFAHKKGQGSSTNGRDSAGRRLGSKASDGETVSAGSILYRQTLLSSQKLSYLSLQISISITVQSFPSCSYDSRRPFSLKPTLL